MSRKLVPHISPDILYQTLFFAHFPLGRITQIRIAPPLNFCKQHKYARKMQLEILHFLVFSENQSPTWIKSCISNAEIAILVLNEPYEDKFKFYKFWNSICTFEVRTHQEQHNQDFFDACLINHDLISQCIINAFLPNFGEPSLFAFMYGSLGKRFSPS